MHVQMGDARKHPVGCNRLYTTVRLRYTCKLSAHPKRRLYGCMIDDTSLRIDLRIICRPPPVLSRSRPSALRVSLAPLSRNMNIRVLVKILILEAPYPREQEARESGFTHTPLHVFPFYVHIKMFHITNSGVVS